MQRCVVLNAMSETCPDDMTAEEMYEMLTDNPDQQEFTPEDCEEYMGAA